MPFFTVAQTDDIMAGTMKAFEIGEKYIVVVNLDGKFYALDGRCSHMKGDLSKGNLFGQIVTCPRHGAKFDVTTGENTAGPKIGPVRLKTADQKVYAVKINGNNVQVDL